MTALTRFVGSRSSRPTPPHPELMGDRAVPRSRSFRASYVATFACHLARKSLVRELRCFQV